MYSYFSVSYCKALGIRITIQYRYTHAFIHSLTHSRCSRKRQARQRQSKREQKRKIENVLLSLSPRWTRQVIYVKYLQEIIVNYEKTSFVFPRCVSVAVVAFFFFPFHCLNYTEKKRDFDSRYNEILMYIFFLCFHFEKCWEQSEWTSERRQKVYTHTHSVNSKVNTIIWCIYGKCAHRLNERLIQTNDKPKKKYQIKYNHRHTMCFTLNFEIIRNVNFWFLNVTYYNRNIK